MQAAVLAAASRRQLSMTDGEVSDSSAGGGAVALVPAGSTHETFTDALVLFAGKTAWMLKMVNPPPPPPSPPARPWPSYTSGSMHALFVNGLSAGKTAWMVKVRVQNFGSVPMH